MTNYTKTTDFAAKDALPSGNSAKIVKGSEIDTEFNNIATASATKADKNNATLTGTTTFSTLSDGTISITAFVDEDDMVSNSAALLPTQQSVKAYVDSQVTAQDLDFQADTGGALSIDLDSETFTLTGGTGIDTSGLGNAVTFAIDSTVATLTGTQTLSNKTLSAPAVSGNLTTDGLIDGRDVATDGTKLDGIESGATADQTAAEIKTAYESNANTNAFTDADESKLDGIESGATADQTATEIKTAYESNADTNAFTDADHTKLDGIEALADVTDTANVTAAGALMDSELTNITAVKALNQGVATTDSPSFAGLTTAGLTLGATAITATGTELNYVDGVTSAIQTQLDAKAPTANPTFTGSFTSPGIDDNADAIAITIDSSENVGIGTNSPSVAAHVVGKVRAQKSGQATAYVQLSADELTSSYAADIFVNDTGLTFKHNSGSRGFVFDQNGTERMLIDASGNVGIGTSSPFDLLHVKSTSADAEITLESAFTGGDARLRMIANSSGISSIQFQDEGDSNIGLLNYNHSDNSMQFRTNDAERARIDSSGNLLVGTTIANGTLVVSSSGGPYYTAYFNGTSGGQNIACRSGVTTGTAIRFLSSSGTDVGSIDTSGSATSYTTSSDYRLKENVVAMSGATERIKQLKPSRFNFITDPDTTVDGFLAHEVQDIVPEAITGAKDAVDAEGNPKYQGIDQSKLVPLLVATIQELEARITQLENN